MKNNSLFIILLGFVIGLLYLVFFWNGEVNFNGNQINGKNLYAKFKVLASNGNSSCSAVFNDSISSMPDNARLQGSCCSPMNWHRYSEQIQGLTKYKSIK